MVTRSLLLAAAIVLLVIAAAPAQTAGEIPLSTPQYGPAHGSQINPKVATNGNDFLVVWADGRGIPGAPYATRVSHDGAILDGTGIRIDGAGSPVGVFHIDGAYTIISSTSDNVQVARIADDGQIIDRAHNVLDGFSAMAAASNGSRIVLASSSELAVLDSNGRLLERFPVPAHSPTSVWLASNGSTFLLLAWVPPNQQVQYALDANGHPTTFSIVGATTVGAGPLMASDGTDFVVVYNDVRTGLTVTQRVAPDATPRTTNALPFNSYAFATGTLTWSGSTYLLVTATNDAAKQLATVTLDRNGAFLGPLKPLDAPGTVTAPSAAWNGAHAMVAWMRDTQEGGMISTDVAGALLHADGTLASSPETLSISANAQAAPVIATGGVNDVVAWAEPTGIYAARVTRSGTALDGRGILVAPLSLESFRLVYGEVRVVFDGRACLVAWNTNNGVQAQRVDADTGAVFGSRMTLAACATSFDLGVDDAGPLLIGDDCSRHIFAQRLGIAGPVGAPVAISPSTVPAALPHMAWNGEEWLVAWDEMIALPFGPPGAFLGNVYAQRVSSALAVRDTNPIAVAVSDANESSPLVASDGRDFLVAWSHSGADGSNVRARRIGSDGVLSATVATPAYVEESLVWDGARYAIAYGTDITNADLLLTHVTREGSPANDRVTISATGTDERDATLIAPAGAPLRVVYTRVAPEAVYGGVARVFARDLVTPVRRRVMR